MNRALQATKLDLNMLRFQEMPLTPKGGYTPPRGVNINAHVKAYTPPSSGSQIREQRRRDQMAANNRRTEMNRLARLDRLFKNKKEITGKDAMTILDLTDHRRGNEALQRLARDGYIALSRTEQQTNFYVRVRK